MRWEVSTLQNLSMFGNYLAEFGYPEQKLDL
jgi:hypothetical protein